MAGRNFDYVDYLASDSNPTSAFAEAEAPAQPTLRFGVVVEVLNDPGAIPAKQRDIYFDECQNSAYLISAPRNSILVRDVTGGLDRAKSAQGQKVSVAYPIFPPHIGLPVKAGETVFLIDPDPTTTSDLMFWLCRIPAADFVDDINFTHWDRTLMEVATKIKSETPPDKPAFMNGTDTDDTFTLAMPDDYDMIFTGSISNKSVNFEAVPRFTKRPGDLALQGSNNTLICLGEDRGFTGTNTPDKSSTDPAKGDGTTVSNANIKVDKGFPFGNRGDSISAAKEPALKGTIDIVAGRGQVDGTKPFTIANTRSWKETNKNPVNFGSDFSPAGTDATPEDNEEIILVKNNWYANPQEGDPDFMSDLSRVYISMKTSGDTNFKLLDSLGDFVKNDLKVKAVDDNAYVIMKSNEVRIVARKDPATKPPADGSILIIREGADPANRCSVSLLPGGKVAIDAKEVFIGDGQADQIFLGDPAKSKAQAAVMGDKLVELLDEFCTNLTLSICNLGVPDSPVVTAATTLQGKLTQMKSKTIFMKNDA